MEVPISVFATKFKKDGKENPAYKSLKDVMDNFVSIAAAGDINKADISASVFVRCDPYILYKKFYRDIG